MAEYVTKAGNKILVEQDVLDYVKSSPKLSIGITSHGYGVVNEYLGVENGKQKYKRTYLHRYTTKAPKNLQVDHIDGNRLNNLKGNLRLCKNASNAKNRPQNSGKYKGVHYSKRNKVYKWVAQITKDYKCVHIGSFLTEDEAALAYNEYSKKLHGKYGFTNIVGGVQ